MQGYPKSVIGNTLIYNRECIVELNCEGNLFYDNTCLNRETIDLIVGISIISGILIVFVIIIIVGKKKGNNSGTHLLDH